LVPHQAQLPERVPDPGVHSPEQCSEVLWELLKWLSNTASRPLIQSEARSHHRARLLRVHRRLQRLRRLHPQLQVMHQVMRVPLRRRSLQPVRRLRRRRLASQPVRRLRRRRLASPRRRRGARLSCCKRLPNFFLL